VTAYSQTVALTSQQYEVLYKVPTEPVADCSSSANVCTITSDDCVICTCAGVVTLKMSIIPKGIELYGISNPLYQPGPVEPRYFNQITFQGISVDQDGKQLFLDATAAYRYLCACSCIMQCTSII
jgi:Acetamidase/Formamidase family